MNLSFRTNFPSLLLRPDFVNLSSIILIDAEQILQSVENILIYSRLIDG